MNEAIWDFINKSVDNHNIMPSWETIAEGLEHHISLDEFHDIHPTALDYMAIHDLNGVTMEYEGEPKRRMLSESVK